MKWQTCYVSWRMSKYICLECGTEFDKPKRFTETHGLDTPPYETYTGCPVCGGAYEMRKNLRKMLDKKSIQYLRLTASQSSNRRN